MPPPTTVLHKKTIQKAIDEVCASNGGSWKRAQKEHLSKVRHLTGSPLSEETLMRDGFSDDPLFYGLVLEQDTDICGVAVFFVEFSTWEGRVLFLKRLVVPSKDMHVPVLRMLAQIALLLKCVRLVWQHSLASASTFKDIGAFTWDELLTLKMSKQGISDFVSFSPP